MITVVTPVSPIPSHPDTRILDETIESIRHHIPDAEIILTFDGVREEQEHLRPAYEEAVRRTLWDADKTWGRIVPFVFDTHTHQVGMLRNVLSDVQTPLIMYVEQDTPLTTDRDIDWPLIIDWLTTGQSGCIRLYHEDIVPTEHGYLMFGMEREAPLLRTSQYSARPHITTVGRYREWLDHFTPQANTFLEDRLHSVVQEAVKRDGWWSQRMHIYAPEGGYKRSYHLDGRAGGPKYDDTLVF